MIRTKQENGTWFAFDKKGITGFGSTKAKAIADYEEQQEALRNMGEFTSRW